MLRQALTGLMYVLLLLVVVLCLRSVWVGLNEPARYAAAFPGAHGWLFDATMTASAAAALNAFALACRQRWAIWTNVAIGVVSLVLLAMVRAPWALSDCRRLVRGDHAAAADAVARG